MSSQLTAVLSFTEDETEDSEITLSIKREKEVMCVCVEILTTYTILHEDVVAGDTESIDGYANKSKARNGSGWTMQTTFGNNGTIGSRGAFYQQYRLFSRHK